MLRGIVHLVGAVQFTFAAYYQHYQVQIPKAAGTIGQPFGGTFKFLTFWNIILQALFFTICVFNDLFGTNDVNPKQKKAIRQLKDFIFASIAFPMALFVATSFWSLYAVDRELVFPKALDPYFPNWLNHVVHTNVALFVFVEMATTFRKYPSRKSGLTLLSIFMLTYLIWTFIIYFASGSWVYPVMMVLNWPQRLLFIAVLLVFSWCLYFIGEGLNRLFWGKEIKQTSSSGKQAKKKQK